MTSWGQDQLQLRQVAPSNTQPCLVLLQFECCVHWGSTWVQSHTWRPFQLLCLVQVSNQFYSVYYCLEVAWGLFTLSFVIASAGFIFISLVTSLLIWLTSSFKPSTHYVLWAQGTIKAFHYSLLSVVAWLHSSYFCAVGRAVMSNCHHKFCATVDL